MALRNPGMRDRHWEELSVEAKANLKPDQGLTLATVVKSALLTHLDTIRKVRAAVLVHERPRGY